MAKMKRILLPLVLGAAIAGGAVTSAVAEPAPAVLAPVVQRLENEGYAFVESYRSWFGRLVVISTRDGMMREVVLNRTTGAILSDRLFEAPDLAAPSSAASPAGTGSGKSSGTDDRRTDSSDDGSEVDGDADQGTRQRATGGLTGRN